MGFRRRKKKYMRPPATAMRNTPLPMPMPAARAMLLFCPLGAAGSAVVVAVVVAIKTDGELVDEVDKVAFEAEAVVFAPCVDVANVAAEDV
jgi:hypothetical protein